MTVFNKISFKAISTEIFTIVVGILLALGANEWNNNRLAENKLEIALVSVKEELTSNLNIMQKIHKQNVNILDKIQSASAENSDEHQTFVPGLQVRDTSWKTFLDSGVTEIAHINLLQSLHEHYAILDMYKNLSYQTIQMILNTKAIMAVNNKNGEQLPNPVFSESIFLIVELEKALIQSLEANLKKLSDVKD